MIENKIGLLIVFLMLLFLCYLYYNDLKKTSKELKEENLRLKYELSGEYNTPFEEWKEKNDRE